MNQYIDHKNQTILWETINKSPLINTLNVNERPEWFKSCIQQCYLYFQLPSTPISKEELQLLNKNTIAFLLNDLKKRINALQTIQKQQPFLPLKTENDVKQRYIKKELDTVELFEKKQKEYDDLFKPKLPEKIDFNIKEIDEPIKDISQLVEKHLREREEELVKYSSSIAPTNTSTNEPLKINNEIVKINDDEIENISLTNKKKVHWKQEPEQQNQEEHVWNYNKELNEIKNKINNLEDKINQIYVILSQKHDIEITAEKTLDTNIS